MKVLKIILDKQPKYYRWEQDRDYLRPGESITGRVEFDPPGVRPPKGARVVWTDSYGREVRSQAGRWNAARGHLEFEFASDGQIAMANYLEVEIRGRRSGRERFVVAAPVRKWDDYHIFAWAGYPYGYYDLLRELGVDGEIAYKRHAFDHIIENDFLCYVDQVSPDEMSVYHRPYSQFWEKPAKSTHPDRKYKWFGYHWDMIRQRYKRARARLRGLSVALDSEGCKTLWRASCPSDRGVQAKMRERIMNTVVQHKNVRPMFYNLADEAGTGDQGAPFDFCHCKHCLERFRTWLEGRYRTLSDLNAQWDTDFGLWREVVPLTTDDTLRRQKKARDFNFSSWSDHREFMDDVITGTYGRMRDFAREADPNAIYGTTGGQGPLAHGGFDYRKIAKNVDLHVPYNIFGNDEMLRSFNPKILKMAPYFGKDRGLIRRMWFQLFHGDCGQIHWDNDQPNGRFIERPKAKPSERGRMFAPALRELTGGIGKQIMSMEPAGEHLALHHSQSSVRANWFMGTLADGEKWVDRDSSDTENLEHDAIFHTRDSIVKLIGDCGLQYRFLAYDSVADGALAADGFKIFFMAHSLAVSAGECDQIRQFVEAGGVVVADTLPAVMDEHCRLLPRGQLDDLFGVKRSALAYNKPGAKIRVVRDYGLPELGKGPLALRALEPTLKATKGAVACGKAAKADCLVMNRVGKGLAIYLNARLRGYVFNRFRLDTNRQLDPQKLLAACMAAAGVRREVNFWTKPGERQLPGIDITRFADEPVEMVGAVISPMRATSGVGEEGKVAFDRLDKAANITVEMPRESHMYNSRTGKYHGYGTCFRDRFDPMDAKLYALLPYEVKTLTARTIGSAKAGRDARVRLELAAEGGKPGRHVIRCDVFDSRGEWRSYYSKNVATEGGSGEVTIPLAASDRAGRWRLELRDCVSGQRATVKIKVGAGG